MFDQKIAFTETNKNTQNEENMFTKKSKFKLFQIVFVAHDSICDCFFFNQKHKYLIYKAIKCIISKIKMMAHVLAHIMFLFCLTCAKIRHNILIFKMVENSQKQIWKVDIILRREINKQHATRGVKQNFLLPHILAHVCQKSRNVCQAHIIYI